MKKVVIIGADSPHAPCAYCGKVDELRPYGKGGATICFDCAMKPENKELTNKTFNDILDGKSEGVTKDQQN